jgi:hypothetical protein
MKSRIMYIAVFGGLGSGGGRMGRVNFSKTGKTIYYNGIALQSLKGMGFKENFYNIESNVRYWISGPKKDGNDPLYKGVVEIDDDINEEYWTVIRDRPDMVGTKSYKSLGKHSKSGRRDKRPKGILSPNIDA